MEWIAIAPLHNFFVPDTVMNERIEGGAEPLAMLNDSETVVYLTKEDEKRLTHLELIRRMGRARWSDRPFAIVVTYQVEDGEDNLRQSEATMKVEQILESMRVFAAGDLYIGGIAYLPRIPSGVTSMTFRSWPQTFAPWPVADANFITNLIDFHDRRKLIADPRLELACHWYSRAVEETRIDDKLISLMTAAEAIVRPTGQYKGRQIADFISPAFAADQARTHALLSDAYRLRNSYVHQGIANATWNADLAEPDVSEYSVTLQTQDVLRTFLLQSF